VEWGEIVFIIVESRYIKFSKSSQRTVTQVFEVKKKCKKDWN